ncbi:putative flippase GtrA [Chitinophaga skermanii]|uniref:Putative flippase GtrA n=1 Tax=Chitinophaga skermanii TaxID=331697 RepID=A0A327Q7U7_9BACT|nr:GtrA family protein [Chitinophaga skermanii]RAI99877.1 putative flippase GtrA [Chitinophaga skermanii]
MQQLIINILSFFYRPFEKYISFQTFRYLACGGGNTLLDIVLYTISYYFVLHEQNLHIGNLVTVSAPIASFIIAFTITFPTGFLLSKFVVFSESNLRGRVQLFRYFLLVGACILLNYGFLKLFVEQLHINAILAKILTVIIVVCFSYITQKKFTFKVKAIEEVEKNLEEEMIGNNIA